MLCPSGVQGTAPKAERPPVFEPVAEAQNYSHFGYFLQSCQTGASHLMTEPVTNTGTGSDTVAVGVWMNRCTLAAICFELCGR